MGSAVAARKAKNRAALQPKPTQEITKAAWDAMPKGQKKRHADGSRFIKENRAGGEFAWVCVFWRH